MNLVVSYNFHGHLYNMVIHVRLLVLNVKMNYVDLKLILGVPHNLIHKYKHALINKGFKVLLVKK